MLSSLLVNLYATYIWTGTLVITSARILNDESCPVSLPFEHGFYETQLRRLYTYSHADVELTMLVPWTHTPSLSVLFPEDDGWIFAHLTVKGIVSSPGGNSFGDVFINGNRYVLVPDIKNETHFHEVLARAFVLTSLFRSVRAVKVVTLAQDSSELSDRVAEYLDDLLLALPNVHVGLLADSLVASTTSLDALTETLTSAMYRSHLPPEMVYAWQARAENIPFEVLLFDVVKKQPKIHVSKMLSDTMKEETKHELFADIEDKTNCLFTQVRDYALEQLNHLANLYYYDYMYLHRLDQVTEHLIQALDSAVSFSQMLFVIKQTEFYSITTDIWAPLRALHSFVSYSSYMRKLYDIRDHSDNLTTVKNTFKELRTATNETLMWKNYSGQVLDVLTNDSNYNDQLTFLSTKDSDDVREMLCTNLQTCAPKPYNNFEKKQILSIRETVQTKRTCDNRILKITGSSIATRVVNDIVGSFILCSYHTVLVFALVQFIMDQPLLLPEKNLIVFTPRWVVTGANMSITLSGDDGRQINTKARDLSKMDWESGNLHLSEDAAGGNGGHFIGYAEMYLGDGFKVLSHGGKGSPGVDAEQQVRDSTMVEDLAGVCSEIRDILQEQWPVYSATAGGLGGLAGSAEFVSLGEEDFSEKLVAEGVPGEHGTPGEIDGVKIYCSSGNYFSHSGSTAASREADRKLSPPPVDQSGAMRLGKITFQELVPPLDTNFTSNLLELYTNLENNSITRTNLTSLVQHFLEFDLAFQNPTQRVQEMFFSTYVNAFFTYLNTLGLTKLPVEDKIRINYLYALLIVRNSRNAHLKYNFVLRTDRYHDMIGVDLRRLRDNTKKWSVETYRKFTYDRYMSYVGDVDWYSRMVINPSLKSTTKKVEELFVVTWDEFARLIDTNGDVHELDKVKMKLQICFNIVFLSKNGRYSVPFTNSYWVAYGFPKKIIKAIEEEAGAISAMTLFRRYLSMRPRPSAYFLVSEKTPTFKIHPELYLMLAVLQKFANDQIYMEMTALFSYIELLKTHVQKVNDTELLCPECLEVFQNSQNLIDFSNDECFERNFEWDPNRMSHINPDFKSMQIVNPDALVEGKVDLKQNISDYSFFTCDTVRYGYRYISAYENIDDKRDILHRGLLNEVIPPGKEYSPEYLDLWKLKNLIHPSNQILPLIEISYGYIYDKDLLEKILHLAVYVDNKNADFKNLFREYKNVSRCYHSVLQEDVMRTVSGVHVNATSMDILYSNWLRVFFQFRKWTGSMSTLEKPFEFFKIPAAKLDIFLSLLIRMFVELKNAKEVDDLSDLLYNINFNREFEDDVTSGDVKRQVGELDETLRLNLMSRRFEQAREAFDHVVFPVGQVFAQQLQDPDYQGFSDTSYLMDDFEAKLLHLTETKKEMKTNIMEHDQFTIQVPFYPEMCSFCMPFYSWTIQDIRRNGYNVDGFFAGQAIHLIAQLGTQVNPGDALKGRHFNLRFAPMVSKEHVMYKSDLELIETNLENATVTLVHSGLSFFQFSQRTYVLSSQNVTFSKKVVEDPGSVSEAEKQDDYLLSPFTAWTFRLHDPDEGIQKVKHLIARIELVGQGQYINNFEGEWLRMQDHYQVDSYTLNGHGQYFTLH